MHLRWLLRLPVKKRFLLNLLIVINRSIHTGNKPADGVCKVWKTQQAVLLLPASREAGIKPPRETLIMMAT